MYENENSIKKCVDDILPYLHNYDTIVISQIIYKNEAAFYSADWVLLGQEKPRKITKYLINRGYANSISHPDQGEIELTGKGRRLKELGSCENYESWLKEEENEDLRRKKMEITLLENHVFLTTEQRKIDKIYRILSLSISIVAIIVSLVPTFIQMFSDKTGSITVTEGEISTKPVKFQENPLSKPNLQDSIPANQNTP